MGTTEKELEVVVAGCIGLDTNVYLYGGDIDFSVEANFARDVDCVGQAGGYSALGFAGLGRRTAFTGSVGRDWQGEAVRRELERAGVEALLFEDPVGTHRSVNLMYRDGRRKNFYDGKGQMEVKPDLGACEALLARARLVHVHLEDWCRRLLPLARTHGVVVSCDLQDVVALEDPYRRDFVEQADILFFSTVNHPEPEGAIAYLRQGRPERVVVGGMGARGCVVGSAEGVRYFGPVELEGPVVDTNGAGDGLAVGFLTSYVLEGRGLEESVLRGQLVARHTCGQRAGEKRPLSAQRLEDLASERG